MMRKTTLLLLLGLLSTSLVVKSQDQASPTPLPETTAAAGGETTPAPETSAAAGGGETTPAPETSSAAGGETTPAAETSAAGGGGAAAMSSKYSIRADDSVLVLINYQEGLIKESGISNQGDFVDFRSNAQALTRLGSIFDLPTYFVASDNQTYGDYWQTLLDSNSNGTYLELQSDQFTFADQAFLALIDSTGRKNVIIAALSADAELVHNSLLAQERGYNVTPVIDASPYYENGAYLAALQDLGVEGIRAKTWLGLSRYLLNSQPDKIDQVNELYNNYLGVQIKNASGSNGSNNNGSGNNSGDNSGNSGGNSGNSGRRFL